MTNLHGYLENRLLEVISAWDEADIYAISFLVYSNEAYEYKGCTNVTNFSVSYNAESDCSNVDELSEERWNYAFWRQDEVPIIDSYNENEGMKILFDWYNENGVDNIGFEDFDHCYDDKMRYIDKGPIGYYELLTVVSDAAKSLQQSGFIKNKFGKEIPIIIHDLEYTWYVIEATKKANPHDEADVFLKAMKKLGFSE